MILLFPKCGKIRLFKQHATFIKIGAFKTLQFLNQIKT